MADYSKLYVTENPNPVPTEQLIQLLRIVWDGDLISRSDRDVLIKMGYAVHQSGFQIITTKGIRYLVANGFIRA